MIRTLALSAVAAMGLMLLPAQTTPSSAAPAIAPKFATPDNAVEQVRRRGGRGYSRGYGRRSYYRGRSYGRRYYGGRRYGHRRYYRYGRYYRRPYIYGAGIPFFYGGYRSSCSYYYRKWKYTGSRYWRKRYYACRW